MNTGLFIIIGIVAAFCLLTMWAFLDIANKDFGAIEKKAIWIVVNAVPFIGCIVYLAVGYKKGKKQDREE